MCAPHPGHGGQSQKGGNLIWGPGRPIPPPTGPSLMPKQDLPACSMPGPHRGTGRQQLRSDTGQFVSVGHPLPSEDCQPPSMTQLCHPGCRPWKRYLILCYSPAHPPTSNIECALHCAHPQIPQIPQPPARTERGWTEHKKGVTHASQVVLITVEAESCSLCTGHFSAFNQAMTGPTQGYRPKIRVLESIPPSPPSSHLPELGPGTRLS